jgi:prevent-host-death family protein
MTTLTPNSTISMMELRNQPGTVIDRVFYRGETFIVEKAGEAKAAIVPLREYEEMKRRKKEAKERFWVMTQELREGMKGVDTQEIQAEIDEAIQEVKAKKKTI